jgi:serine/threonine protein phosphatase PrpC
VQSIDLAPIFQRIQSNPGDVPVPMLSVVICSDGVWDNWTYEDVTKFVMDPSCMNAVASGSDGGRRVTASFMQRNGIYAKRNFGSQADNATGIVIYLSPADSFPGQA